MPDIPAASLYIGGMDAVSLSAGRTYLLSSSRSLANPPLVVMLHGTGGSASFAADETQLAPFAEQQGFAVAFGEALPVHPTEEPKFLSNPRRWNEGLTTSADPFHASADDVAYLSELIDDALRRTNGDRSRVYLTGFSNGAGMTFRLAAERPELLAAIAPVAGYCPRSVPKLTRAVPTLFLIGDADLLIPSAGGTVRLPWGNRTVVRPPLRETLDRWAERLGCSSEAELVIETAGICTERYPHPEVEFVVKTVAGLGHHWPGGKGQFNPRLAGPVSDRLLANAEIWTFFQRHQLQ